MEITNKNMKNLQIVTKILTYSMEMGKSWFLIEIQWKWANRDF